MIKTHLSVMEDLREYASPKAKLTRMLKSGTLIQVRRGLFVDGNTSPRRALAPVIYGPSYISFQYAIASYGLIPERVSAVTCATFGKNRDKVFRTPLGEYRYLYLPSQVYPYGLRLEEEEGSSYLIASPEKALCDAVYKTPSAVSCSDIETLLVEDWRIEKSDLLALDRGFIEWIAPIYKKKSLLALSAWYQKETCNE